MNVTRRYQIVKSAEILDQSEFDVTHAEAGTLSKEEVAKQEAAKQEAAKQKQDDAAMKRRVNLNDFWTVGAGGRPASHNRGRNGLPTVGTLFVRKRDGEVFYLGDIDGKSQLFPIAQRASGKGLAHSYRGVMTDDEVDAFLKLVPHGKHDAWRDFLDERSDVQEERSRGGDRFWRKSLKTQQKELDEERSKLFGHESGRKQDKAKGMIRPKASMIRPKAIGRGAAGTGVKANDTMLTKLLKLANTLRSRGLQEEVDLLGVIIQKATYQDRLLEERNYMMDSRTNAKNAWENYDERSNTITLSLIGNDEEEEEKTLSLPARLELCDLCNGKGKVVDPSIDAGGISQDDFYDDPDFEEEYFEGTYDVACPQCNGQRVVPAVDYDALRPEEKKEFDEYQREQREAAEDDYHSRRVQMAEMGYGW